MSIFSRKRIKESDDMQKSLNGGDYGIHFPWISVLFLIVGIASEATDTILMINVLQKYTGALGEWAGIVISIVTGFICFASMASIGYQSANKRVKYRTKLLEVLIWLIVGIFIAFLRVFKAFEVSSGVINEETISTIISAVFMGVLQFLLYLGSGLITYSSSKQLTNGKLYEYLMAQRAYDKLIDEVMEKREFISNGINILSVYPEYAKRLNGSRKDVLKKVKQYNKATKALCEAKMAVMTNPDQMDDMYEEAKAKEIKENGRWAATTSN